MVLRVAGKEIRRVPAACSRARVNQVSGGGVLIHCRRIWSVGRVWRWIFLVHFFVRSSTSGLTYRACTGPLWTVAHPHFRRRAAHGSFSPPPSPSPTPKSPCLVRLSRNLAERRVLDHRDRGIMSHDLTTVAPLYHVLRLGFDTMCLHAGYDPHGDESVYGLGQGAPRGVPLHRTAPFQVRFAPIRCSPRSSKGHNSPRRA